MSIEGNKLSLYNKKDLPNSEGMRFVIVVSDWNPHITEKLYNGAKETLISVGVKQSDIIRMNVPGSFELIFGARIASNYNYDAIICLGSIIKGETEHFHYICNAVSQGIKDLNVSLNVPVIFGVLTDKNEQQSLDRSGGKFGNKGVESAIAAVKMAHLNK